MSAEVIPLRPRSEVPRRIERGVVPVNATAWTTVQVFIRGDIKAARLASGLHSVGLTVKLDGGSIVIVEAPSD